eukprot:COSAG03_NODE_933_length_5268_cov_25.934417_7_plen_233_part_00
MDPTVVTAESCESNWYLEVHQKVMALIPQAYTALYQSAEAPSEEEWAVLTANELAEPGAADPEKERRAIALVPHPLGHGWLSKTFFTNWMELVSQPMTHTAGFAVPNQAAIDAIAALSPIIEVGAGTGTFRQTYGSFFTLIVASGSVPCCWNKQGTGRRCCGAPARMSSRSTSSRRHCRAWGRRWGTASSTGSSLRCCRLNRLASSSGAAAAAAQLRHIVIHPGQMATAIAH